MIRAEDYVGLISLEALRLGVRGAVADSEEFSDGCIALLRAISGYRPELGPFVPYALRAIRNEILQGRRERAGLGPGTPRKHPIVCSHLVHDPADRPNDPSDIVAHREEVALVRAAMDQLPAQSRQALIMYFWLDQNTTEMGASLGITRAGAHHRLKVALRQLRLAMSPETSCSHGSRRFRR